MAPKRLLVKLKLSRRKDDAQSSQTKEPVASSHGDDEKATLAAKAAEASSQSHGPGMSPGAHIKQEPTFGTSNIPSAPTSSMAKTSETRPTPSTAADGERATSPCYANANDPVSMDVDNGSNKHTTIGNEVPFASDHGNRTDVAAPHKTVGPNNGADASQPDQPTTNIEANAKIAKKRANGAKRKGQSSNNEGPPTKNKPAAHRKPRKHTLEAVKYVSHANALVLSGKTAKLPRDVDLDLPTVCQAPPAVRGHLKELEKAGLSLPHAKPETIKIHVKVLSGLCHAFKDLEPWLAERDGEPRVDDFKWQIKGLSYPLHSHQLLGSAIMNVIEREESQGSGLLLDFMGFGKTVQTLACIVSNRVRPKKKDKGPTDGSATTLVVVPKSAATQWVEEVKRHTDPQLSVMLWTKQTEMTRDVTLAANILIVTYDQVRLMRKAYKTKSITSLLFDVCYQRIVLDESHKIKNRKSEIFEACMKLKGKHRWALTGTPIPNGVHELWPYLRFIRHPSVKDFAHFKQNYLTKKRGMKLKGGAEYEDLSKILLPISIMRTPGHQFCGIPLVTLPQDHAIKEVVPLGAEEKVIQRYLKQYIMDYIQMKCGGESNYFCLAERFLRYRQCTASPLLLEGPVKDGLWTVDQMRLMKEEAHNAGAEKTPIIDMLERWISEPKRYHLAPTGNRKLDSMLAKADIMICPLCSRSPIDPQLAECGHIWCWEHVTMWQQARSAIHLELTCPKCDQLVGEVRPHHPEEASDQGKDAMGRPKGVDNKGFQPADDEGSTLFQILDQHADAQIPLSAKMKRMLELIIEWQAKAPDDKIIVFYHFIGISRILARLLQARGIGYLYFLGQMNSNQRQNARVAFETEPAIKVLMVSITTGGEALNLTMANRCIIYDPWWHGAVEEQAFGRVNRIGQKKETHCVHLSAMDTIDERMNELQKKKKKQQSAIAELEAGKGLTAKTLRRLLDDQIKKEGGSDGSDADTASEDSGDDYDSDSEYEDPNDGDWGS